MKYDYLIVGAGFSGCVLAERISSVLKKKVIVIDKRNHIGGNCYDYKDENGILIHKYGPHAFHTINQKVWDYLSSFTKWTKYEHKVLAEVEGKKIPVPFNLNSLYMCFRSDEAKLIEEDLISVFGYGNKIPVLKLKETNNNRLKQLADYVYDHIFYGYTLKQWGYTPEELDRSVTGRIPIIISRDDRYFHDTWQALPANGYTELFKNMLNNELITVQLNTDYKKNVGDIEFNKLIYTGPIDLFFDFKHGRLPYRSLRFEMESIDKEYYQETTQVNYPEQYDYTRITEFKHFYNNMTDKTTIAFEYPEEYIDGVNEPYYPIPRMENELIYNKYAGEVEKLKDKVYFLGRLANYKYYNMDQVVAVALQFFEKKILPAYGSD